jgi:hypothetical protein
MADTRRLSNRLNSAASTIVRIQGAAGVLAGVWLLGALVVDLLDGELVLPLTGGQPPLRLTQSVAVMTGSVMWLAVALLMVVGGLERSGLVARRYVVIASLIGLAIASYAMLCQLLGRALPIGPSFLAP